MIGGKLKLKNQKPGLLKPAPSAKPLGSGPLLGKRDQRANSPQPLA